MQRFRAAPSLLALSVSFSLSFYPGSLAAEGTRPGILLEGSAARLHIDLAGGAIGRFEQVTSGPAAPAINPLDWGTPKSTDTAPHGHGHFLCLDRWGPPSKAEGANGMPYHGEAASVTWRLDQSPTVSADTITTTMSARLPLAGLAIRRTVRLAAGSAFYVVREEVSNEGKLGRIYNMVQHPTIAPPFLDPTTVVDCNGGRGFAQGGSMPNPETPTTRWPRGLDQDGTKNDLRHLGTDPRPAVSSFAIDGDLGWVTAATPRHGLLIGYLWRTRDYPWVSLWRNADKSGPSARGLEFGTTGLHQPFPILTRKGRIFELPLFDHLDSGETTTRSYASFLVQVPADFLGVDRIESRGTDWVIIEHDPGVPRRFPIATGGLAIP
jgi:hypothetical protein